MTATTAPVTTTASTLPRAPLDAERWQHRLDALAPEHRVVGASLAILRLAEGGADEVAQAATGVLNVATAVPATTSSVFQIGSITKVWTATLVMQLVEEGLLDLDAPVRAVLPDLALADDRVAATVTARQLLDHTSGIDGDVFTDTGRGDDCVQAYVASLSDAAQNHPPGATFSYCNSGYSILGRVVEVLRGTTWDAAIRERIAVPLGLARTTTLPEETILHGAAVGHEVEDGQDPTRVTTFLLPRSIGPAGLVTTTAVEAAQLAAAHLRGGVAADGTRILGERAVATMQEHSTDLPDTWSLGDSWGLGWIRYGWQGHRLVGHDGSTLGQNAYLRALPEQGLVVALLTNGGHSSDLAHDLLDEIFVEVAGITPPAGISPPEQPYVPDAAELAAVVGTYERAGVRTEVVERDDGLAMRLVPTGAIAEIAGQAKTQEEALVPVSRGLFAARPEGTRTWMAVTLYHLDDGSAYLHVGARANPKRS